MNYLLTLYMCSMIGNTCSPAFPIKEPYIDLHNCLIGGYQKSIDKLNEIGPVEVNEHKIFIKFVCTETKINVT